MMKTTKLTLAAALLAGSCSFAMAQGGAAGGEPPKASDANPPAAVKQQPGEAKSAPVRGAQAPAPKKTMKTQPTGMPGAKPTSTGNMNTKGTGKGTTGTGGPGGSGNE